ncbi:MAG: Crp/Fnr family transcriptional regulator [Rhodospirillales bacterium]|jgi:CRP/FNR family transcriptional regulator, cyclic AMP receptor protein|nr:Crp/Fnr family transcriptional regulator [Rhodospirillales bacterium]MBT4039705.1 Crp/Fnr family transcriptional regulator [Rhodospirillales bacterium]MBT4628352.1 Crp/Fnr family transcriptional regulator [Rhodospirillales bacterium]MBT5351186.1 Crp/Fnr family transcriptional regulator [Rhodospirillales bacterium]MBT5521573.1 Crp/Fnr family transcriptional regulator [Rhodospirillales bacterium]
MSEGSNQSLNEIALLEGLPAEEISALEQRCSWNSYAKGQTIIERDSDNQGVYLISVGKVRVVNFSLSGKEIAYANIIAGDYFGELSAVDGRPRSAAVVAVEPCVIAVIPTHDFHELLMAHPGIGLRVMGRLASIIRTCDDRIMDLSTLRAIKRVYSFLLDLSQLDGAGDGLYRISPIPTHADIASQIGTTRETVARAFSELQQSGVIARKGSSVTIIDHETLTNLMAAVDVDGEQGNAR